MIRASAYVQALLEGVPLPAAKRELLEYARVQGADRDVLDALRQIPEREYASLDEVGEAIAPVQPVRAAPAPFARTESGPPPGGEAYSA